MMHPPMPNRDAVTTRRWAAVTGIGFALLLVALIGPRGCPTTRSSRLEPPTTS